VRSAYVVLLGANLVYSTSYVATRVVLDDLPPALLALVRLVVGAAVLVPIARALEPAPAYGRRDGWRIAWMGAVGFAGAFAFTNWGLARSTATNAALLIIVEPVSIMALSPLVLGAVVVVLNGVPGLMHALAPHWRGDLLLVLSGLAYGAYTLIGRGVLARHGPLGVTARSIVWGAAVMAPFALLEWAGGARPVLSLGAVAGGLYLALVITVFGYLVWNWALPRVGAPRAAISVTVQPIGGAILGVVLLREPLTAFTVAGGVLVVLGLWLTVTDRE
jgi:drug/metabolite transporter (DMT)-like permease